MLFVGMLVYRQLFDRYYRYDDAARKYIGSWIEMTDTLFKVERVVGSYAKLARVSAYSQVSVWTRIERVSPVKPERMESAMRVVERSIREKYAMDVQVAERKAVEDAATLSRNTVTRALVHAADNGYCNETVIALVSAGHKMPEGTVSIRCTVDIPVDIDGKDDYYILRGMFGATRGDLQKLVGESVPGSEGYNSIDEKVRSKLADIGATMEWNSSITVSSVDIDFPRPTIRPIADVVQASPAYYSE